MLSTLLSAGLSLSLAASVLLRLARLLPQAGLPAWRHALRSLFAPGSQALAVVVAMGVGIMLVTAVYLLQEGLVKQLRAAGAGEGTPNLYAVGVAPEQRLEMRAYLQAHPDVKETPPPIVVAQATVLQVDGKPVAEKSVPAMDMGSDLPKGTTVHDGVWFTPADQGKPLVAMDRHLAESLGVRAGSRLRLLFDQQEGEFTVAAVFGPSGSGVQMTIASVLVAAPGAIDRYAGMYLLSAVTRADREEAVLQDLMKRFPGSTVLGLSAIMEVADRYLSRLAAVIRFITGFAVVAAGVILSGSLAATRLRRRKEAALLKALGASRRTVATAIALESGMLGLLAGLLGGGMAYGLVYAAARGLGTHLSVAPWPLPAAALAGAALAVAVSTAAARDVLQVRPLAVLRGE